MSSYSLVVGGWIVALTGTIVLFWTRSTVLSLPTSLVRILVAPALIFCLGLHGIYSNSLYDVGKDLWYFVGPVIYIAFGYLVFERLGSWQRLVQPLVVIGAYCVSRHHRVGCFKPGTITCDYHSRRLSPDNRVRHICSRLTDSRARAGETCRVAHDRHNTPENCKGNQLCPFGPSCSMSIFQNSNDMPGRGPRLRRQSEIYAQTRSELHGVSPGRRQSYWHSPPACSIVIRWAYF